MRRDGSEQICPSDNLLSDDKRGHLVTLLVNLLMENHKNSFIHRNSAERYKREREAGRLLANMFSAIATAVFCRSCKKKVQRAPFQINLLFSASIKKKLTRMQRFFLSRK